jgi:Ca2+-binding RTX toxin-like protein
LTNETPQLLPSADVLALTGMDQLMRWNVGAPVGTNAVVTFSFARWKSGYDTATSGSVVEFSEAQKAAARKALAVWGDVSGLVFVELSDSFPGQIRFGLADLTPGISGYAYFPDYTTTETSGPNAIAPNFSNIGGDIFLSRSEFWRNDAIFTVGQWGYSVLLHEIGHAIGFKHPFTGTPTINPWRDSSTYTIMSYNWSSYPIGLGSVDLAAVQYYYGTTDIATTYDSAKYTITRTGTAADEWVLGSELSDRMYGQAGDDVLLGYGGLNTLDGGAGDDIIYGGEGLNSLYGNDGNDWLFGSYNRDILIGGDGDDIIFGNGDAVSIFAIADSLDGGAGNDTLIGSHGGDTLIGGEGDDSLSGNAEAGTFYTRADSLDGGAGNDTLIGSVNNDTLIGGAGHDLMIGGTGDDSYLVDLAGDIITEGVNAGIDSVFSTVGFYLPVNVENLTLLAGAGDIFGVGNALANRLNGNDDANLLIAGDSDDILLGAGGNDVLYGQDGADSLEGGTGIDYLIGGAGNDTLLGGAGADVLYGEAGDDSLVGGADFVFDLLVGGEGQDTLDGASGLGDFNYLYGGDGDDVFHVDTPHDLVFEFAGEGNDTVFADISGAGYYLYQEIESLTLLGTTPFGVGNNLGNTLTGSAAGNWLLGGAGNDTLNGMGGDDVLFGEAGADTFVFTRGTGGDVIGDFAVGIDHIRLVGLGFSNFTQLQAVMSENGGSTAINLGYGDFIVLSGVARASLSAADFLYA